MKVSKALKISRIKSHPLGDIMTIEVQNEAIRGFFSVDKTDKLTLNISKTSALLMADYILKTYKKK